MHPEAREFLQHAKNQFSTFFTCVEVLDVGSGDINGNNRSMFCDRCVYHGNDVAPAKNVTIVSRTKDLPFHDEQFDVVVSSECFEHDPEHTESFQKIFKMLKPGGMFLFTCASTDRPEHGTRRTSKMDSYGTINKIEDMQDYYKNLTIDDVDTCLNLKESFSSFRSYYNRRAKDLYFIGFKKGGPTRTIPMYTKPMVSMTMSKE